MSDGSRDIFHKPPVGSEGTVTSAGKSVSPLERLLEKLRYVTMMKIEENDDLPRLLCDLCIVQLNVAYNFKRQAVENDTKLRQYFIENGITSNQAIIINEAPSLRSSFTASNISQAQPHSRFPIVPLIVKTEPSDVDAFSDITTETNVDLERTRFQSVASNTINSSPEEATRRTNNSVYSNDRSQSSMVYVNSGYEFNSVTPSSDIEFVQNYQLNTNNNRDHNNTQRQSSASKTNANSESNPKRSPSVRNHSPSSSLMNSSERKKVARRNRIAGRKREIANLTINMVPETISTTAAKEHRRTSGKTTRVRPKDDKNPSSPSANSTLSSPQTPSDKVKTTDSPVPIKRPAPSNITLQPAAKKPHTEPRIKPTTPTTMPNNISSPNKTPQKVIVINPFNTTKRGPKLKVNKKPENGNRKRSQEKLLRPKIEPPATKKN